MNEFTFKGSNSIFSCDSLSVGSTRNPIALRKAKIAYNFGLSECNIGLKKERHCFSVSKLFPLVNKDFASGSNLKKKKKKKKK